MANKAPAFQFYAKDWLDMRVMRMSYEAQGVYMRLLAHMWADSDTQFSIEDDHKALSRMLGLSVKKFEKIFAEIQWPHDPIFILEDGFLISKRLRKEKEKQVKISIKRSESAGNRWGKTDANASASAEQEQCKPHALQSSSSSSSSEKDKELRNTLSNESVSSSEPSASADTSPTENPQTGGSSFQGQLCQPAQPEPTTADGAPKRAQDRTPHESIVALYHEILPMCPQVKVWNPEQKSRLRTRWKEDPRRQSLDWWRDFFQRVAASDWLTGRVKDFVCDLDWLVGPQNMAKVLNGRFDNHGPRTGSHQTDRNVRAAQAFIQGD